MYSLILNKIKVLFFYFTHFFSFKKLSYGSLIIKPLRINGGKYISLGPNTLINELTWLYADSIDGSLPELVFNEGCIIGRYNHIAAVKRVIIERNVLTSDRVYISDNMHGYDDLNTPITLQPVKFKSDVIIGEGTWIGTNACIIGAKIGKRCIICENTVVTADVPDYCRVAGNPGRITERFDQSTNRWEKI